MIRRIYIDGFKCLKEASIPTGTLNVFVGPNAAGKSSVLQALLLLRQSADEDGKVESLHLSGPLYEAGTAQDVFHPASEYKIRIAISDNEEDKEIICDFANNKGDDDRASSRVIQALASTRLPRGLFDRNEGFAYLNAERIGPRVTYALPPSESHLAGAVGKFGEHTAAVLARAAHGAVIDGVDNDLFNLLAKGPMDLDQKNILNDLINSGGRLDIVTKLLLGWILPGSDFDAQVQEQLDSASVRFIRDPLATRAQVRATHIGFGLVYSLPIIVATLALRKRGLMLIENPEAHLHPFSQSRMGVFLAAMAHTGRQIFVETHSDHVVNGIRLALKHNLLNANDVCFTFINRKASEDRSFIMPISVQQDGRLARWPEGFFDQIENDLSKL